MASIGPNNPAASPPPQSAFLHTHSQLFSSEGERSKAEAVKMSHTSQLCVLIAEE